MFNPCMKNPANADHLPKPKHDAWRIRRCMKILAAGEIEISTRTNEVCSWGVCWRKLMQEYRTDWMAMKLNSVRRRRFVEPMSLSGGWPLRGGNNLLLTSTQEVMSLWNCFGESEAWVKRIDQVKVTERTTTGTNQFLIDECQLSKPQIEKDAFVE